MYPALGNIRGKCHQNASNWPRVGEAPRRVTMTTAILSQEHPNYDHPFRSRGDLLRQVKAKTASKDIEAVTMKNGRAATRSTCVECGTKKFRIGVLP